MIIAIDFDGTCVVDNFPKIGRSIGAEGVLRRLIVEGHKLILWTLRGTHYAAETCYLLHAIEWFRLNDIPLMGINENPELVGWEEWSRGPKVHADLFIDDRSLGVPLYDNGVDKPFVDWVDVEQLLIDKGILHELPSL